MNDLYPAIAIACEVLVSGRWIQPVRSEVAEGILSFRRGPHLAYYVVPDVRLVDCGLYIKLA